MASAKRLKPFTFFGRVPQGTTTLELTKILVTRFSKTELGGVQDFTGGKFEIFLKTRAAVERFLLDPVVEVKGTAVTFEYRGTRAKLIRAFGYSSEHHDVELATALAPYGKILSVSRESVPGFPTVTTGIRRVKMEMKSAVPNFLDVIDTTVQLEYEGVLRVCRKCGAQGHMGANCDTAQCSRCGAYGHEVCEAACPKCGQDHPVKDCRKRTFASVVGGDEEHEEPATIWEQPALVQPSNALSAQTSSADKGSCGASALSSPPEDDREPPAPPASTEATLEQDVVAERHQVPLAAATAEETIAPAEPEESLPAAEETDAETGMEVTSARAKRKRSPRKPKKTKKSEPSSSSKSLDSVPLTKRAFLKKPTLSESSSESDDDQETRDPCQYCNNKTCDCELISDNSYESTERSPPSSPAADDTEPQA